MRTKLTVIAIFVAYCLSGVLLTGCSEDESNIIGGGTQPYPVSLILDVTDADGNSLLDFYNNPNSILFDEDTRAEIKAVEDCHTYPLETQFDLSEFRADNPASRCTPPAFFRGLYLSTSSSDNYYGSGDGPYLSFGQFEGDEVVNRSLTLYLPGYEDGIRVDYRREKDMANEGRLRTVIFIDGIEQHDAIPRIVIPGR